MKKFDKNCVFCKIASGEMEKEFIFEDNDIMVFPDLNPNAPVHLLIVPKTHVVDFMELSDSKLENKLMGAVRKMINKSELKGKGFRMTINGGGAQIVNHLHIHVTGPIGRNSSL